MFIGENQYHGDVTETSMAARSGKYQIASGKYPMASPVNLSREHRPRTAELQGNRSLLSHRTGKGSKHE